MGLSSMRKAVTVSGNISWLLGFLRQPNLLVLGRFNLILGRNLCDQFLLQ